MAKTPQHKLDYQKAYREANKDKIKALQKAWKAQRSPDQLEKDKLAQKKYRQKHLAEYRAYQSQYHRERYNNDPEFKNKQLEASKRWHDNKKILNTNNHDGNIDCQNGDNL